ncbi:MAG: methanogenesis marker 3 protein [Methanomassiliicoccales archaeon]|nr:MAG: methanogenesis marker 3 protein [Methanomassiliicoccales archaeon]
MKIIVNKVPMDVSDNATVADVISGQPYKKGTAIALIRSMEQVKKETSEFEVTTNKGSFVIKIKDGPWLQFWKESYPSLVGKTVRWQTSKVTAIGSFISKATPSREPSKFTKYDCLFALGGYDNRTTYIMIARMDHEASYGVASPIFGRVTRGRHVLDILEETDKVISVEPVIIELSSKDAFATTDISTPLEEGMSVETYVAVKLDNRSPVSVEHFLVALEKGEGTITITDKTESFTASSTRMDVNLVEEAHDIREEDVVTVRHTGPGMGRIYFYQRRRQVAPSHNIIGKICNGHQLIHLAPKGERVTVVPDPMRVMVIGMTQREGMEFLSSRGLRQKRTGLVEDDMVIVEQEPELTIHAIEDGEVETFGTDPSKITTWYLYRDKDPNTVRYIEKMTGLDHKPIGTVKVHFTYEGMPMVTFEGDDSLGAKLYPEPSFGELSRKCDIGVTNMSRPNRGIIGIRLEDSNEFGPTGEEAHGTNLVGRYVGDLSTMMNGLKDGDIVYVRETTVDPDKKVTRKKEPKNGVKKAAVRKRNSPKKKVTTK